MATGTVNVEEKGMNPFQAAIEGTREIGLAVLATTLSLMAVFVPIGFMQGIVGRFMSSFGLTASFAVLVSLIVSFSLTPMLAARLIKKHKSKVQGPGSNGTGVETLPGISGDGMLSTSEQRETLDGGPETFDSKKSDSKHTSWFRFVDAGYTFLLRFSMGHRWVIILCVFSCFWPSFRYLCLSGKTFCLSTTSRSLRFRRGHLKARYRRHVADI